MLGVDWTPILRHRQTTWWMSAFFQLRLTCTFSPQIFIFVYAHENVTLETIPPFFLIELFSDFYFMALFQRLCV